MCVYVRLFVCLSIVGICENIRLPKQYGRQRQSKNIQAHIHTQGLFHCLLVSPSKRTAHTHTKKKIKIQHNNILFPNKFINRTFFLIFSFPPYLLFIVKYFVCHFAYKHKSLPYIYNKSVAFNTDFPLFFPLF